ncbi:glycoside hydrolase family 18 protein [Actinomadura logoneensis]|uniref:hypothetical protein n=1 Tax=Actinomadura logoneensis TaxID=2293572 RepID=UPI0018F10C4B|nr:hypothetical protein [Actinomadura logoneensis]
MRRILWWTGWCAAYALGLVLLAGAGAWAWWQPDPEAPGTGTNALWARHQWVGETHTDAEYRAFARLLRDNRITDVYFHAGPFEPDGTVPTAKYRNASALLKALRTYAYRNASALLKALRTYAPDVRAQAYLGQIRKVEGKGVIEIGDARVQQGILRTDAAMLDAGFAGIHYDFEPIYPDDTAFLRLLDRTRDLTRARGRLLSVALEQPPLADALQPVFEALAPRTGAAHYPPRPTDRFLRDVADRADQVAIMTYDTEMPTQALAGWHYARHTERVLRLIGDRTTVFMGVPTYRPVTGWAENLEVALRGVRRGVADLPTAPRRPYGVGVYADWTTSPADWARYRANWLAPKSGKPAQSATPHVTFPNVRPPR